MAKEHVKSCLTSTYVRETHSHSAGAPRACWPGRPVPAKRRGNWRAATRRGHTGPSRAACPEVTPPAAHDAAAAPPGPVPRTENPCPRSQRPKLAPVRGPSTAGSDRATAWAHLGRGGRGSDARPQGWQPVRFHAPGARRHRRLPAAGTTWERGPARGA